MSKNGYIFPLSGGTSESSSTELRDQVYSDPRDNLLLHGETFDFPELITALDNASIPYEYVEDVTRGPSGKSIRIHLPQGQMLDVVIPIESYTTEKLRGYNEEQFFILSLYYNRADNPNLIRDIALRGAFNIIDQYEEDVAYSGMVRKVIKFKTGATSDNLNIDLQITLGSFASNAELWFSSAKLERSTTLTSWKDPIEPGCKMVSITKTGEQTLFIEPTGTSLTDLIIVTSYPDWTSLSKVEAIHILDTETILVPISLGTDGILGVVESETDWNGQVIAVRLREDNLTDEQRLLESRVFIIGNGYTYTVE